MTIKTPTPRKLFLLLIILMVIFCALISVAYWLKTTDKVEENWAMDQLTTPDNADLQSRINRLLLDTAIVDVLGIGADIDSTLDQSAMDAKLVGLTKNVTTQKTPTNHELEDFYQRSKDSYREPSKFWLKVVSFSLASYGGQVFEKAQLELDKSAAPEGDLFDRYGAILSTELEEKYGWGFTAKLFLLIEKNDSLPCWAGPISSAYGAHLVCVEKINWGAYTPLQEIRSQLINDWRFAEARELEAAN